MEWKTSGMGIRSLAMGVASLPCGKEALAAMKPETRAALTDAAEAVQRLAGDDLCGVKGEIKPQSESATARTLAFDCSWS